MPPDIYTSIANEGLQHYLDRTRAAHNGNDYAAFMAMLKDTSMHKPSKTKMAQDMGVSRMTISKWINIARLEKKNAN